MRLKGAYDAGFSAACAKFAAELDFLKVQKVKKPGMPQPITGNAPEPGFMSRYKKG